MRLANITVQQLIDALPEPVQIINPDFSVDLANHEMREKFRCNEQVHCYEKFGRNGPCPSCPIQQVITNKETDTVVVTGNNGKVYSVFLLPLGTPEGAVVEFVRAGDDSRFGDKVEVLKEQTDYYADKIGTLTKSFFGMAHNLKNPLTAIQGKIQIFGMRHPEFKTEVENLMNQCDIINNMLIEMNQKFKLEQNTEVMPIDLNDVIANELRFLNLDLHVKHKISKIFEPTEKIAPVMAVYSDLSLIFNNLLQNAIAAVSRSERKDIELETSMEDGFIVATIEDSGCGIPNEHLPRIFMPFYRINDESDGGNGAKNPGKGLGLFIVYELVQKYRGQIEVESTPGVGTKFKLKFPGD